MPETQLREPSSTASLRLSAWVFVGSILIQVGWLIALPPFAGMDEFDHAYRAASVASGQWLPSGEVSSQGRGELVRVSPGLVEAAEPACSDLPYTGLHNCSPAEVLDADTVTVATAAARYNPVFYWAIGTAAKPFDGSAALYAMRIAAILLSSVLIAAAAWVTTWWARTSWPLVGLLLALTPTMLYSTTVAAPNGIEMAGALGLWVSIIGFTRVPPPRRRHVLVAATVFAIPLVGVRGLGPLWLACIVVAGVVAAGPRGVYDGLRSLPRTSLVSTGLVAVVAAASTWWTFSAGSMEPEILGSFEDPVTATLRQVPVWFLQSIGAFPMRNQAAPVLVYAVAVTVMAVFTGVAWWRAHRRIRWASLLVLTLAVVIPFGLQVMTYETAGAVWQGRYGWPLAMGVILVLASALDDDPPRHRLMGPAMLAAALLWAVAHAASSFDVMQQKLTSGPFAGDARWTTIPPLAVVAVSALGVAAWALAWRVTEARASESAHPGAPGDVSAGLDRSVHPDPVA